MSTCNKEYYHFFRIIIRKASIMFAFLFFSSVIIAQVPIDTMIAKAREKLYANDYPNAMVLSRQSLEKAQSLKDSLNIGNANIILGISYDKSGDFENALSHYFTALPYYEAVKNYKKQGGTLKNIGNTYRVLGSFSKAYDFFTQAIQKYTQANDSVGLANITNDLGLLFMDQNKLDTAIQYFTTVITVYKNYAVKEVNAFALNNLGLCYLKKKDFTPALNYFNASSIAMDRIQNDYGKALVLNNIGNLLIERKMYKDAITYSLKGLQTGSKIQSKETIANSLENLAIAYRELQDYKKSSQYFDELVVVRDSIFKEESAKSYAEMESKYQNEKKQKEILLLKKDNAIKDLDIINQRRTRTFLLISLLFIIAIASVIYRNYAIKQRLNEALNIANDKLSEANQSKTKLLSIISHDLRTPVSSLFNFLQLQKSSPGRLTAEQQEKFNTQINNAAENVLSTMEDVLIWSKSQMEKFEPVLEKINLSEYLTDIINLNATAAANKKIDITQQCDATIQLNTDPNFLKIILRNLLSNAIKFTNNHGQILLAANKVDNFITITVKDNGVGMNEEQVANIFKWNNIRSDSSGLGLRLAKEFTEKLSGNITVSSKPGDGTTFTLHFKI